MDGDKQLEGEVHMFATIRHRATYANVVATIALILAVGGGSAYALQGRNTVFSDDIAPDAVKAADAKEESLKIPRIRRVDVSEESTGAGDALLALAECPTGYSVSGGGFQRSLGVELESSIPYTDQTNFNIWRVDGLSTDSGQTVSAIAICQRGQTLQPN